MNDRDLLDMVAQEAPSPEPELADDVVRMARRVRFKRRTTALVVAAGLAVGCSAVIVVAPWAHDASERVQVQPSSTRMAPDPAAAPYAMAIRTLVTQGMSGDPSGNRPPLLYVLDHTCAAVDERPPSQFCVGRPFAKRLQDDLAEALSPYAPVTFVPDAKSALDKNMNTKHGGYQVTLGPIQFNGSLAGVPLAIHRNPQDGRGTTLWLTWQAGQWTTGGKPRPGVTTRGWIS
ncbi:MAG: hypothetical protein JWN52_262 [Actinomycetia bacterium]|nr:hypothetical protein [Actinomycetes bacterium]